MLGHLRIVNLGVISDASIEFAPGMTALSGETGAGKTMIVTGLGLLLGDRAAAGVVRSGETRAVVEGRFGELGDLLTRAADLGAESDYGELLASRLVQSNGRSRAMLGGVQVTIGQLGEVLNEVSTIHGQSEQIRLGTPDRQREVLDAHGGEELVGLLHNYRSAFEARRAARAELAELTRSAQERNREIDLLSFGLDEIDKVSPTVGEDVDLAAEAAKLQAVDDLRQLGSRADFALSGSSEGDLDQPGAVGLMGEARKASAAIADLDANAAELAATVSEVSSLVADAAAQVAAYLADLEADPARLEQIAARQAALQALTRKYGADIAEVLAWAQSSATRLTQLMASDDRIETLQADVATLDSEVAQLAARITERRGALAADLASRVERELAALAMPNARITFALTPLDEPGPWGAESIHLLLAANPGAEPAPLSRVASGGELSRIRLAIEVALADVSPGHTFVFDEVDAGIGGTVASEVGRRLARLAQTNQVIVVTHLAQVAAFADRHYVIAKSDDGQVTTSDLVEVSDADRLVELSRMMGGTSGGAGLAHARELVESAHHSTKKS